MQESKPCAARFDRGASELPSPGAVIDVRVEIANAPVGPYHLFLATVIGMVVFFDGYDTFNPAYVIHYVMKPWRLVPSQAGLVVSSGLIGFMIGALLQGKLSDRHGRRRSFRGYRCSVVYWSCGDCVCASQRVARSPDCGQCSPGVVKWS